MDPAPPTRVPLHTRTISYRAYEVDADHFDVVADFADVREWRPEPFVDGRVHEMRLEVTVRRADLTIMAARAGMSAYPHAECPLISSRFEQLVGLRVVGGYAREIDKRFKGGNGCAHLHEIARGLGPAVVQASVSAHARHRGAAGRVQTTPSPGVANTCHIWVTGGIGDQKFTAGWRIGDPAQPDEYPIPPVEHFRARLG